MMRLLYFIFGLMIFFLSPAVADNFEQDESLVQEQATPSRDSLSAEKSNKRTVIYSPVSREGHISLEKRPADAPIVPGASRVRVGKSEAPE